MRKNLFLILIATAILMIASLLVNQLKTTPNTVNLEVTQDYPQGMTGLNPQPLPEAVYRGFDDQLYDPGDFRGQYILINFWATWCPPCVVEFPELVAFAGAHQDQLAVMLVSNDKDRKTVEDFFNKQTSDIQQKMQLENVVQIHDQTGHITRQVFQTYRLPESYLIDPDGMMIAKIMGAVSEPHFEYIKSLLP